MRETCKFSVTDVPEIMTVDEQPQLGVSSFSVKRKKKSKDKKSKKKKKKSRVSDGENDDFDDEDSNESDFC